jgi:hypothetical protein
LIPLVIDFGSSDTTQDRAEGNGSLLNNGLGSLDRLLSRFNSFLDCLDTIRGRSETGSGSFDTHPGRFDGDPGSSDTVRGRLDAAESIDFDVFSLIVIVSGFLIFAIPHPMLTLYLLLYFLHCCNTILLHLLIPIFTNLAIVAAVAVYY